MPRALTRLCWMARIAFIGLMLDGNATGKAEPSKLDYNRDVRPVLSDACFRCHGPDRKRVKGGLRLDDREEALKRLDSGKVAIVAGQPEASELVRRIFAADPEEVMPPPDSHRSLTRAQRDLLRRWVREGAVYAPHWAFVPPRKPVPPEEHRTHWAQNAIDRFVLSKLESEGLAPSPEAERATLVRRLALDLTGLPQSMSEVTGFLHDATPDAWERLVDRLMSTRDYAERRAQDWLDLARYADTRGFADDGYQDIWPYRDWVVHAIHNNQPFDQFTMDQLAGDLLPNANREQRVASAFHRNAPQAKGQTYPVEEYRLKGVVDRVNTSGTVWLGLTLGCAECHDHKFDPISQVDYYRLFALFNQIEHSGEGFAQGGPDMEVPIDKQKFVKVPVMKEMVQPRETRVHLRGNFLTPGERVSPGIPKVFGLSEYAQPTNRLAFARWLVSGTNPLVARVVVNQCWQVYFGHGLVRTPADFGLQGEPPTHPELLDWLACDFVDSGWNMKRLHRLIVTSATYRQAARIPRDHIALDPDNRWLSWMSRLRLPGEQIRDQALFLAGLLRPYGGGPSVFPPQPGQYWEDRDLPGKWIVSHGDDRHRKSMYIHWRRMALHPTLELLDAPARVVCTARRTISNMPTQALVTLNDPIFVEAAGALADRVLQSAGTSSNRVEFAFRLCLGRLPDDAERQQFMEFLQRRGEDERAAWTSLATVLLNLDETLNRP